MCLWIKEEVQEVLRIEKEIEHLYLGKNNNTILFIFIYICMYKHVPCTCRMTRQSEVLA